MSKSIPYYGLILLAALAGDAWGAGARLPPTPMEAYPTESLEGQPPLDLKNYHLTFDDEFDRMSVTADGGAGPWYAPVHPPFGAAKFAPPSPDGPFLVRNGIMTIRAERKDGVWRAGLMQTVNSHGEGFAQTYGYFEARIQLPPNQAGWPAFWLLTQDVYHDPTATRGEIDVLERPHDSITASYNAIIITPIKTHRAGRGVRLSLPNMTSGFHTYGVMIDPVWTTFYYDRKVVSHYQTLDPFKSSMYLLVDLATHKQITPDPDAKIDLKVDYVRAYAAN